MRIVHELLLNVSLDEAQLQTHFKRAATVSKLTVDTYQKHAGSAFQVLDTQSKTLSLVDVTSPAKGLYLEVDADCDVTLNGSVDAIQLRKAPASGTIAAADYAKLFLEGNITSIEVAANQGSDVNGTYVVWGDALP